MAQVGAAEYDRSLAAKNLDQATLDAEGYGQKKSFKREDDGLRITLAPGEAETGWKTPPQLRFGGDFTVSANFVIKKLPKPAMEDGVAVGMAIAFRRHQSARRGPGAPARARRIGRLSVRREGDGSANADARSR